MNLIALSIRFETSCRISGVSPSTYGPATSSSARSTRPFRRGAFARVRDDVGDQRVERQRFFRNLIAGVGLGEREHPADHLGQPRRLIDDRVEAFGPHRGIAIAPAPDQLRVRVDHGQRRLEFVRGVGDELPLAGERALQAVEHRVERRREPADLIAALPPQPAVEFFRADLLHRAGEPHDRIDQTARDEQRGDDDGQTGHDRGEEQDRLRAARLAIDDVEPLRDVRDDDRLAVAAERAVEHQQRRAVGIAREREAFLDAGRQRGQAQVAHVRTLPDRVAGRRVDLDVLRDRRPMVELLFVRERVERGLGIVETQRVAGFGDPRDLVRGRGDPGLGLFDQQFAKRQTDRDRTDRDDDDDQQRVGRGDARPQ